MSTITAEPLDWSSSQLDDLFESSPAGDIPSGRGTGTVIVLPGSRASKPLAAVARVLFWQGKVFRPESHDVKNLLSPLSRPGVRAEVYQGESWFDGRPCVVLDYSTSSRAARQIRDEIRQIGPDHYLGMVFRGARRLNVYFTLQFG